MRSVHSVIFTLSFVAVVSSSYGTGGCEACPQVGHFLLVWCCFSLKDGKNNLTRNFKQRLFTHESILQWSPFITDTIGTQHFGHYSEVSQAQGLPV